MPHWSTAVLFESGGMRQMPYSHAVLSCWIKRADVVLRGCTAGYQMGRLSHRRIAIAARTGQS
jgi:hypothetical protein